MAIFHRKCIATATASLPQRNRNLFPRKNRCVEFDRVNGSQASTANHRRGTVHLDTCSFSYQLRGAPGIWGFYQAIRVATQEFVFPNPDLLFLAFLDFLAFFLFKDFLAILSVFPSFPKDFRGSASTRNPCLFGGFPCRFPKRQGKEDQGSCWRSSGDHFSVET